MNKSEVTAKLKSIKNTECYCFNFYKKMPQGSIGFVDYVLLSLASGNVYFIECKLGADKMSAKQIRLETICKGIAEKNSNFKYFVLTEKNIDSIIEEIEQGEKI